MAGFRRQVLLQRPPLGAPPTKLFVMCVAQDREQPPAQIGAGLKLCQRCNRTCHSLLDQIVRLRALANQKPGERAQLRQQCNQFFAHRVVVGVRSGNFTAHAGIRFALGDAPQGWQSCNGTIDKGRCSVDGLNHDELVRSLPYVRRYARALTGSQRAGDNLVAGSLKKMMADGGEAERPAVPQPLAPRYRLYQAVTSLFDAEHAGAPDAAGRLPLKQRQLLLLTQLEEVPIDAAAAIVGIEPEQAGEELAQARALLHDAAATDVLIIEDEPIIAMDIEELVRDCGHSVIGVAATESEAVAIAMRSKPGLILADINLGLGGDGTSAVARILRRYQVPVIFVTAYPERLLTGETVEPAFVITKPFDPMTLAIATYQAVTGGINLD